MPKMIWLATAAVLLTPLGLIEPPTRAAELEGALQYPPASVGEDVQPPPPPRMVPQPLSPRRIELGPLWPSAHYNSSVSVTAAELTLCPFALRPDAAAALLQG